MLSILYDMIDAIADIFFPFFLAKEGHCDPGQPLDEGLLALTGHWGGS